MSGLITLLQGFFDLRLPLLIPIIVNLSHLLTEAPVDLLFTCPNYLNFASLYLVHITEIKVDRMALIN